MCLEQHLKALDCSTSSSVVNQISFNKSGVDREGVGAISGDRGCRQAQPTMRPWLPDDPFASPAPSCQCFFPIKLLHEFLAQNTSRLRKKSRVSLLNYNSRWRLPRLWPSLYNHRCQKTEFLGPMADPGSAPRIAPIGAAGPWTNVAPPADSPVADAKTKKPLMTAIR